MFLAFCWTKQSKNTSRTKTAHLPKKTIRATEIRRTLLRVKGVPTQTKGAVADVTAEALAVEEIAFGAEPLHHVNPLPAKVTGVAAT